MSAVRVCSSCGGWDSCEWCDTAHQADMRALRREQLRDDVSDNELAQLLSDPVDDESREFITQYLSDPVARSRSDLDTQCLVDENLPSLLRKQAE